MTINHPVVIVPVANGGFLAVVPHMPDCRADGATPEAALRNVILATQPWIENNIKKRPLPDDNYESMGFLNHVLHNTVIQQEREIIALKDYTPAGIFKRALLSLPILRNWNN